MLTTKIKSIRKIGKKQVYDFKVPKYHNFILGNNIIVHNSGKSTLCIVLARKVSAEFTKLKRFDEETIMRYWNKINKQTFPTFEDFIEKIFELKEERAYKYNIRKKTIYMRDKIIQFFDSWHNIAVGDEMVMAGFNRDFYNEEQKDLIKIINTNRDHNHAFFGAIPSFNNLDTQIKGLTKIRITVIRRGLALIHTPNKTMYGKDKWDTHFNEKLEREWLKKKIRKPQYARFTTVRGMIRFPDLPKNMKLIYEEVKKDERNIIAKEQFGITEDKSEDPMMQITEQLVKNGVKNGDFLQGVAQAHNMTYKRLIDNIRTRLNKLGKNPKLRTYFWDNGYNGEGSVGKPEEKTKKQKTLELVQTLAHKR
jgi:hypothetical protein